MIGKLRLVDAAAIAAAALLALKGLEYLRTPAAAPANVAGTARDGDNLPEFARVLAHARSNYTTPDVTMTGSTPPKKPETPAEPVSPKPSAFHPATSPAPSPTERVLLERLGERRDEIKQRAKDLDIREKLLENAEKRLDDRVNELRGLEERADPAAAKAKEAESAGMKNLVLMYETMKPKEAARVFDRLSLDVLVPVVLQMNPRKMAEVLAVMAPESAEKLTVALANRARGIGDGRTAAAAPAQGRELPGIEIAPRN